jgi:hypothetical protein
MKRFAPLALVLCVGCGDSDERIRQLEQAASQQARLIVSLRKELNRHPRSLDRVTAAAIIAKASESHGDPLVGDYFVVPNFETRLSPTSDGGQLHRSMREALTEGGYMLADGTPTQTLLKHPLVRRREWPASSLEIRIRNRKIVEVTGIAEHNDGTVDVEFTWSHEPNEIGRLLRGPIWDGAWKHKWKATAQCRRYDDGWRFAGFSNYEPLNTYLVEALNGSTQ